MKIKELACIYQIEAKSGKKFIGSTTNFIGKIFDEHIRQLKEHISNVYHEDDLVFTILEDVPKRVNESDEAFKKRLVEDREQYYMDTLQPEFNPGRFIPGVGILTGHPEEWLDVGLMQKYRISAKEYKALLFQQNECCKICGIHREKLSVRLFVDHDHTSGNIRGLLCSNCNSVLGHAFDDIAILGNCIKYLNYHNKLYSDNPEAVLKWKGSGIVIKQIRKEMMISQNKACKICGKYRKYGRKRLPQVLFLDHNHLTGQVREMLCNNCNALLGHANESIAVLENAIKYLQSGYALISRWY